LPVSIAVLSERAARVPLVTEPFWIGRDPGCDLCLWDLRISRKHARVTRKRGEYLLSSEGKNGVFFKGERVPVLSLRHGDEITLTPPDRADPVRLRFENLIDGVFVTPGTPLSTAWATARPGVAEEPPGVRGRWVLSDAPEPGGAQNGLGVVHRAREGGTGEEVLLRTLPAVLGGAAADAWLQLMAAIAGAQHPSLVRVLEAGLSPRGDAFLRWIAMEPVAGRPATARIAEGPQSPVTVVRRLRGIAAALHLLHDRGVVHGAVVPSNVLLKSDGGAVLIGLSHAYLRRDGRVGAAAPRDESAYAAPESVEGDSLPSPAADVYGLAAIGRAMLTGRPDATFEQAGVEVPPALVDGLARSLSRDPADRPSAEDLGQILAFVEAAMPRGAHGPVAPGPAA
jgi:hypothetical protein